MYTEDSVERLRHILHLCQKARLLACHLACYLKLQQMPYEAGQPLRLPDYGDDALDLSSATDGLLAVDWVRDLLSDPHVKPVLTAGALVSKESELPPDHMVRSRMLPALVLVPFARP